jgi:hypothetical protein
LCVLRVVFATPVVYKRRFAECGIDFGVVEGSGLMRRVVVPILALAAMCVLLSARATQCHAGILVPQQVSFGESDLEKAVNSAASTHGASGASSSSSNRHRSPDWPTSDSNQPSSPLELAKSLPTGGSTSSTSTSSTGGAIGSGVVFCVLNGTLTLRDESPLGQLAEDHGFCLPEAPGTDLLRPPQCNS